jgi:glutamate-5-semialdehyde dehydrogenase
MIDIQSLCRNAKQASRPLALLPAETKNAMLGALSAWLSSTQNDIIAENRKDIGDARDAGLSDAMIDRLTLTPQRIQGMAAGLLHVAELPDPVGEVFEDSMLPNGLHVSRQRVPLGVLAVIYESRPNVTIDVASLALKSGNALVLRGGSETIRSNRILVTGIHEAMAKTGMDEAAVQFIDDPDRELVTRLLKMDAFIDMLIPRGGAGLHRFCRENASMPVMTGGIGICHLYVDASADLERSLAVIRNAKIQRPSTCNSLDTVLVHQEIAARFIPKLINTLRQDGVSFRIEEGAMEACRIQPDEQVQPAGEGDFDMEWLSLVLGVKAVSGLDEAMAHIAQHSTSHSDGILTADEQHAARFVAEVDSAAVYVNASTRFTDGAQMGLGAEVAVSTQRLHARGPMGLRELTTYKWVVRGDYHSRP